jgi:eukaryotic-like serine/threonine-protein kinase
VIGKTVAHYRIERRLGEGGMGVVYEARDQKLERSVALKLIRADLGDPRLRDRFWREARAAAQVNHPGICQVHEIGELEGEPFIVMELLEGETLAERIARGPLPDAEVVRVGLGMLDALAALHRRGLVHRDLKPSNVFLLADGRIKVMDFGLVLSSADGPGASPALTMTGTVVGSPQYMSPEQIRGATVDGRSDLFAVAAVLFEAATGRPAFRGAQPVDAMYAVLHDSAPLLEGSLQRQALGRVLARALAKAPDDRFSDATAMAAELGAALPGSGTANPAAAPSAPPMVRLAVLPFRMLRPDPELEFLGPSLADAIALSLAGIRSLLVRSSIASARYGSAAPELDRIAAELDVDRVLYGTILPHGERCRVVAQLVEAPGGRVMWSLSSDVSERDVFQLQDDLTRRIVESLQLPLSSRERVGLDRNVPTSATAYELFLRANRSALGSAQLEVARDLYRKALDIDPNFAPAWARLGRCYRVLGKYLPEDRANNYRRAEDALARAVELHADHPMAHYVQAELDLDMGRTEQAIERLLAVVEKNPNDAAGYSGLVTALRHAGMLEESLASHHRARELDPEARTSVGFTYESMGDLDCALEEFSREHHYDRPLILVQLGRHDEARRELDQWEAREPGSVLGDWMRFLRIIVYQEPAGASIPFERFMDFPDPESHYLNGGLLLKYRGDDRGAEMLLSGMVGGYFNLPGIEADSRVEAVRRDPRFLTAWQQVRERHQSALARYGERARRLLGLQEAAS